VVCVCVLLVLRMGALVPLINDAGILAAYSVEVYVSLSYKYVVAAVLSPAEVVYNGNQRF